MGGATISFLNLVRGLKNKGYEIVVVCPDWNEEFMKHLDKMGISHHCCPIVVSIFPSLSKLNYKGKTVEILRLIRKKIYSYRCLLPIIKKEKPDIIHTNVGVVQEGFFCAKRLSIPHVWHLREYQDKGFNWRIFPSKCIFQWLLQQSYVISITKDIHLHFELKESIKHRVIYNGILPADETYLLFPKEPFFLCASRISREKGHDTVIRAFAKFYTDFPEYKLKILGFGDNSYINELQNLCKRLGCEQAVDFLGYSNEVCTYMKKAKALIVASHNEGFGRMTAEASFCGCIVIGRYTAGTKEIMDVTGGMKFLNEDELLEKMRSLLKMDDDDYREIVMRSQRRAVESYSIENNVEQIDGFYKEILKWPITKAG